MRRLQAGKGLAAIAVAASTALAGLTAQAGVGSSEGCDLRAAYPFLEYTGDSPRVRIERVEDHRVFVLLPPDYYASEKSYPVLYFLPPAPFPADALLGGTDLIQFTAEAPIEQRAIVVMPEGRLISLWADWRNGRYKDENLLLNRIMPLIDSRYRTIPGRAHTAIAGISNSGFAAASLAGRHPDTFAAVAAFSGATDINWEDHPFMPAVLTVFGPLVPAVCDANPLAAEPFGIYGDPVNNLVWWHNASPPDLATNYAGTSTWLEVGNAIPCDLRDVRDLASLAPFSFGEQLVHDLSSRFDAALDAAGVPHTYVEHECGIHTFHHWEAFLHHWWPEMISAFGAASPTSFRYRSAEHAISVWEWAFDADPARAPEFLDVTGASAEGLTLTGSGIETVRTADYFTPGELVALHGALETSAVADSAGRITFHVDLGPAHTLQQYTLRQRAAEALAGDSYWTTKSVTFGAL